jgi:DNA repair exonuclease SbcCD ATPase subunit
MGGCFNESTYDTTDYNKALEQFNTDCQISLAEEGNNYSGGMGMFPGADRTDKEFNSHDKAVEWLQENQDKWENAKAVKFKNGKVTESSQKKQENLYKEVTIAYNKLIVLKGKFSEEIRNQKSKTKACKTCDSKINKTYIKLGQCPVCGNTMYNETQKNRIAVLEKKSIDAQSKRNNFKPSLTEGEMIWMFGGWCSA